MARPDRSNPRARERAQSGRALMYRPGLALRVNMKRHLIRNRHRKASLVQALARRVRIVANERSRLDKSLPHLDQSYRSNKSIFVVTVGNYNAFTLLNILITIDNKIKFTLDNATG